MKKKKNITGKESGVWKEYFTFYKQYFFFVMYFIYTNEISSTLKNYKSVNFFFRNEQF